MAKNSEKQSLKRIAIVNEDFCRPKKCNLECKRACPVNRIGKKCITIETISRISEALCIGCGACEKKCPFNAIKIINLPTEMTKECSHRYGENSFRLHRLPVPKAGSIVGLVGTNGIGKSTALKILSGKLKPNLGDYLEGPDWPTILKNYRGSELHGYFTKLLENTFTSAIKIQYIDRVPRLLNKRFGTEKLCVRDVLEKMDMVGKKEYYIGKMTLGKILDRCLEDLSGGELQRLCIALTCMQDTDVYVFDEPSSYLDVKQRLCMGREIRKLAENQKYVLVVEHDLAILDMLCDYGCVLYGESGAYGIITMPYSIKSAINIFLDGYIPTENVRFRDTGLKFELQDMTEYSKGDREEYYYPNMRKTLNGFKLEVEEGKYSTSEITVLLGENGMGKSLLVKLMAGITKNDDEVEICGIGISYKPQKIMPKYKGTVRDLFMCKIQNSFLDQAFYSDYIRPLKIDYLMEQEISSLSGGELQRIALILCLGRDADLYLIDEPSAFLDADQRIAIAKIIKRFVCSKKKAAFVVEHDLIVTTYIADKIIWFSGEAGVSCRANRPVSLTEGMNKFLKSLDVTFRRDMETSRPRVNKPDSTKDKEQKKANRFFFS